MPAEAMTDLVYDLRDLSGSSDAFYDELSAFCDLLIAQIDSRAGAAIRSYGEFVQAHWHEQPRSTGEYAIDLLMLGLALRRYCQAAEVSQSWAIWLARRLFSLRTKNPGAKAVVDFVRAGLIRLFLQHRGDGVYDEGPWLAERLPRLIAWLEATGEFEQESLRIDGWRSFLAQLPQAEATHWMETAVELFDWFSREAEWTLGGYTKGVKCFLSTEYAKRGCREDQVFCGKAPVEYHLGMAAAEIMNRGLRAEFDRTPARAVLVPACMRGEQASSCRARISGVDMICSACDSACAVNRITRRMRGLGAQVYLVPHSTGFSKWLERWQRTPGTGVVAVACLLNILPGGYEMRSRAIPSQCVPLDYPGCRKHWRRKALATGVNEGRLVQITSMPSYGPAPVAS